MTESTHVRLGLPSAPKHKPTLLDLPLELKIMIFEELCPDHYYSLHHDLKPARLEVQRRIGEHFDRVDEETPPG